MLLRLVISRNDSRVRGNSITDERSISLLQNFTPKICANLLFFQAFEIKILLIVNLENLWLISLTTWLVSSLRKVLLIKLQIVFMIIKSSKVYSSTACKSVLLWNLLLKLIRISMSIVFKILYPSRPFIVVVMLNFIL